MRVYGSILIALSLLLGTVAAVTAYLPRLAAVAAAVARGETITLAAPAGAMRNAQGQTVPVLEAGTVLAADELTALQQAGVERVAVREFAPGRWSHLWMFGLGAVGLVVGARMVRRSSRPGSPGAGTAGGAANSRDLVVSIVAELDDLHEGLQELGHTVAGRQMLLKRLGDLQSGQLNAFAAARDRLVGEFGTSGFAGVMSRFSLMERQVNRAWSAAADGVLDEAHECVGRARELAADLERSMA